MYHTHYLEFVRREVENLENRARRKMIHTKYHIEDEKI
jgi:hypothetical protein